MTREELMALWPKNASDRDAAERLAALDRQLLTPIVPDMVEWLKTSQSVRKIFGRCLSVYNADAVEPIRRALLSAHEMRSVYLLRFVLPHWRRDQLRPLFHEIESLLQAGSLCGVNVYALALLGRAGAVTPASIKEWAGLYRERLNDQIVALDCIEASLVGAVCGSPGQSVQD